MRIVLSTYETATQGGNYVRCSSLAAALAAISGHDITLLAASSRPRLLPLVRRQNGMHLIEMPGLLPRRLRHAGLDPLDVLSRLLWLIWRPPDLVHGFGHRPAVSLPCRAAKHLARIPYLADWADHWGKGGIAAVRTGFLGRWLGWFDDRLERTTFRAADGLTVITSALLHLAEAWGMARRTIWLLPPGAGVDAIHPQPVQEARQKLGLPQDVPIAVYIGNADYDFEYLAQIAVALVRREPAALLLLAGRDFSNFSSLVRAEGVEDHIVLLGTVPYAEIGTVLACGDVMLLPYTNQPVNVGRFPNKTGDYLAAGRPIVANPTGDLADFLADSSACLFAEETPGAFADAVIALFQDKERATSMSASARRFAEEQVSWKARARTLLQIYHQYVQETHES